MFKDKDSRAQIPVYMISQLKTLNYKFPTLNWCECNAQSVETSDLILPQAVDALNDDFSPRGQQE